MKYTSSNLGLFIFISGCLLIVSMSSGAFSFPMHEGTNEVQHPREIDGRIQQDQDELRMRLFLLSWLQSLSRDPSLNERIKAKRTCFVNAGLSHSCDYKNALAAMDEERFFTSDQSPGRK